VLAGKTIFERNLSRPAKGVFNKVGNSYQVVEKTESYFVDLKILRLNKGIKKPTATLPL
jgi:hypothetical protein